MAVVESNVGPESRLSQEATQIFGPLQKGAEEAPLCATSVQATPRYWKAVSATFPTRQLGIKTRRVAIITHAKDKAGKPKAVTVAYAIGDKPAIARYRAAVIVKAVNAHFDKLDSLSVTSTPPDAASNGGAL